MKPAIAVVSFVVCTFMISLGLKAQHSFSLKNDQVELVVNNKGELITLRNAGAGTNYASGKPIWRLYFDEGEIKDNEVWAKDNAPVITATDDQILIKYDKIRYKNRLIAIGLELKVKLSSANYLTFSSKITNNEDNMVVRELQYPLVADCNLPADYDLITTEIGGQKYSDPKERIRIANKAIGGPYMAPSNIFLQMESFYPHGPAANCFTLAGEKSGLYFGSHDPSFEDTGHGYRLYGSIKDGFNKLELGIYKYPNCLPGATWENNANVIAVYQGSWRRAADLYRNWANSWWKHQTPPLWVQKMKGWQRIIMRHQYGETLFTYDDLGTRVKKVGESVGLNTVLTHGWFNTGHDNMYPDYVSDPKQGGDKYLKKQIAAFQKDGGAVLLYYNGKLIDKASEFYKSGKGKEVSIKDNTGSEITEAYKFRGPGTFTGTYNSRTFVVADARQPLWQKELIKMADQAVELGAKSVFYDQLGMADKSNWDLTGKFPVPSMRTIADKALALKMIHEHLGKKNPDIALGTEHLYDVTAQHVDYIHSLYGAANPNNFIDWFRYTFPEIILSDREIRDDTDIERRVNHAMLKGLRNDVEIYRARALIDEAPNYQQYLSKINQLKNTFEDLLLLGKYTDQEYFDVDNSAVQARSFVRGDKMAIVVTQSELESVSATIHVADNYKYMENGSVGDVKISGSGNRINVVLGKNGITVLTFQAKK